MFAAPLCRNGEASLFTAEANLFGGMRARSGWRRVDARTMRPCSYTICEPLCADTRIFTLTNWSSWRARFLVSAVSARETPSVALQVCAREMATGNAYAHNGLRLGSGVDQSFAQTAWVGAGTSSSAVDRERQAVINCETSCYKLHRRCSCGSRSQAYEGPGWSGRRGLPRRLSSSFGHKVGPANAVFTVRPCISAAGIVRAFR